MNMYSMLYTLQHVRDASGKGIGATAVAHAHRNFTMPGLLEFLRPPHRGKKSASRGCCQGSDQ